MYHYAFTVFHIDPGSLQFTSHLLSIVIIEIRITMDVGKETAQGEVHALNSKYEVEHVEADAASDKRLVRKIDVHVIPILILLFAFSLIDRNIIATARVAGMGAALDLTGNRYSVALLVLFPLYILVELPANFILRKISVKAFFFGMVFCWGVVAMCHAFVNTFAQLVAVRVLLGFFEGAFQVSIIRGLKVIEHIC